MDLLDGHSKQPCAGQERKVAASPDEIEAEVLRVWRELGEAWSPPRTSDVCTASPDAQFLCKSDCMRGCFFYLPAVCKYYHVVIDGNYDHGYETVIEPVDRDTILNTLGEIASRVGWEAVTSTGLETGEADPMSDDALHHSSLRNLIEQIKMFPE